MKFLWDRNDRSAKNEAIEQAIQEYIDLATKLLEKNDSGE